MSIDAERLVSYRIPSYSMNTRLTLEPTADPYHPQHPSDAPPLVRAGHAPPALSKMRVSIPAAILHSMADIEIQPSHQQLRGMSVAITAHMAPGWLGATSRAREFRHNNRRTNSNNNGGGRSRGKGTRKRRPRTTSSSLALEEHCAFSQGNARPSLGSHSASVSQFSKLKDPLSMIPSSPIRRARERTFAQQEAAAAAHAAVHQHAPVTFVDGLPTAPGAWGNARHKSFEGFTETTKRLIQGNKATHGSVLHRVAVM